MSSAALRPTEPPPPDKHTFSLRAHEVGLWLVEPGSIMRLMQKAR